MAHELDSIALKLTDHKELLEYFATKKIGQVCRLEVVFQVNELNGEICVGSINEANPVNYSDSDDDDESDIGMRPKGSVSSGPNAADRYATM